MLYINAKKGEGIELLKKEIKGQYNCFMWSIRCREIYINKYLSDKEHMETGIVTEKIGRGRHTTRHSEIIDVSGGYIVDTPGFSTLDVTFIDKDDLKYCFPEFEELNNECKFRGCLHHKEPVVR